MTWQALPAERKLQIRTEAIPARRGGKHGIREGTRIGGKNSRDTRPGNATRYLESADSNNLQPLMQIWRTRLAAAQTPGNKD